MSNSGVGGGDGDGGVGGCDTRVCGVIVVGGGHGVCFFGDPLEGTL